MRDSEKLTVTRHPGDETRSTCVVAIKRWWWYERKRAYAQPTCCDYERRTDDRDDGRGLEAPMADLTK